MYCGKEIKIPTDRLLSGHTKSCGCLKLDFKKKSFGEAAQNEVFDDYKRGANSRGLLFNITKEQFLDICSKRCHYCNSCPSNIRVARRKNGDFTYNGIDRVDNNKGYEINNCVPCCVKCNIAKYTQTKEEFLEWIQRVYLHSVVQ